MRGKKQLKTKPVLLEIINNLAVGGGQNVVCELVKNIDPDRYQIYVLCSGEKTNTLFEEQIEKICSVSYMGIRGRIGVKSFFSVMKRISKIKPDIIHTHMGGTSFGLIWGIIHNKPVVLTVHSEPKFAFSSKNEKLIRYSLKHKKTMLVAVSKDNYNKCLSYFEPPKGKCSFVNNGIDIDKFYTRDHAVFSFINVACHEDYKNQKLAIDGLKRVCELNSQTHLYLIGDGSHHDSLIQYANELGLSDHITFTGRISNPEEYISLSDVYLQPSHTEAMPMSVLEAMAAGLPIISTDVGGLRDVVKDNGVLVQDGKDNLFYEAMIEMRKSSPQTLHQMSIASKRIVENYSSKKMATSYMEIYDNLLR